MYAQFQAGVAKLYLQGAGEGEYGASLLSREGQLAGLMDTSERCSM